MPSALSYLLAARRCEIADLEQLAATSDLTGAIARLVHALQRERGISNIYLGSRGSHFAAMRLEQVPACEAQQRDVLAVFARMAGEAGTMRNGARLFNRVAIAVDALEGLPGLRERIAARTTAAADSAACFARVIAALLAVVFEAVDSAGDAEVSRELVAMFHFMQGKEYAGQERALGAEVFASGRIDAAGRQRWLHLIQQQHQCFETFREFADPPLVAAELAAADPHNTARLERMRRIGQEIDARGLDESAADAWYECCTARLDAMRELEDLLASHLRALCSRRIGQARALLRDQQAALEQLHQHATSASSHAPSLIGPQLGRSVLDMVHEQARRLQEMHDELETARAALNERKLVERAKGLLMAHRRVGEDEAHRMLRQMAMNQKRRMAEVAQAVLAMADMLPPSGR